MNWKIVAKYLVLKWSWIFSRIHNLYVPYYQYDIYRILIQDATRVFQKKPELLTLREDSGVLEETGTAYSSRGLGCLRRNRNCLLFARTLVSQKKPELLTPREDSGVLEETGTAYSSRGLGCLRRNRNCLLLARTRVHPRWFGLCCC